MTFPDVLEKRPLGSTGLRVTHVGLGGAWLGRTPGGGFNDDIAIAAVHHALQQGINLIDTSPLYGESERRIGLALKAWFARGGRREDFVLTTKTGTRTRPKDYSGAGTRRSVEESLRLLNVDHIDVVLIHDPDELGPALAPGGALDELEKMKSEGLLRAIGLGVRQHDLHRRCIDTGRFQLSLTYRDFNLVHQTALEGVVAPAASRGMAVFNATVVIGGLLGGQDPLKVARRADSPGESKGVYTHSDFEIDRAHELWQFACQHGINLLALNLQYCLREKRVTSSLLGVASAAELDDDLAALRAPISEKVWEQLRSRFRL